MESFVDKDLIYKLALSMTKGVNAEIVRHFEDAGLSYADFFTFEAVKLSDKLGMSRKKVITKSDRDEALLNAHKEFEFINRHNIRSLFLLDDDYPFRLKECDDAPVMLYVLGDCDLNSEHFISMVGTRKSTPYGNNFCDTTISELKEYLPHFTVVSGLAYGIDIAAHTASLKNGIPTIAVLAHGLNMIYPATHRDVAQRIIKSGGALITEYNSMQKPHRSNFLERNRIVAGMCDATIVVESDIKGGAMSTAQLAFDYGREVMALPGRATDALSRGCNSLIRRNKASLITNAGDIIDLMNWNIQEFNIDSRQRVLFPELTEQEQIIYDTLRYNSTEMTVDEISRVTHIPITTLLPIMTEMEFNGVIIKHPGNRYSPAL